jgi:hypothetical protein
MVMHFDAAVTNKTDGALKFGVRFMRTVVCPHSVPESIVSNCCINRDSCFTAHYNANHELAAFIGVKLSMNTARYPR